MDNTCGIIVILVILILIYLKHYNKASFIVPSDKVVMYETIIKNKDLFVGQDYIKVKSQIPWVDAGIYYDVKQLIRDRKPLNYDTLSVIFRSNII